MFAKITDYVFGPSSEGNDPDNHPDTNASTTTTTTTTTKHSYRTDREVVVTSLHVFPIKSCRGISIDSSHVVARGLEFDREWAIREVESRKIITAREYPQALRIVPRLDFENNVMVVSFPPESGLAGFSVRLRADEDEIRSWERTQDNLLFDFVLPGSAICPTVTSPHHPDPVPSPAQQLSAYFGTSMTLIRVSPDDDRSALLPKGTNERKAWRHEVAQHGESLVRFVDEQPILLASQASLEYVSEAIQDAASDQPRDQRFNHLGTTFDKNVWKTKTFDPTRFRANIIVGSPSATAAATAAGSGDQEGTRSPMDPFEEDTWGRISLAHPESPGQESLPMFIIARHARCQLPNVDPESGEPDKAVPYKVIAKTRRIDPSVKYDPCLGVGAVSEDRLGTRTIKVGDIVSVVDGNEWESMPPK